MQATMLYNRAADKINKHLGYSAVTTCQVPKGEFDGYFKDGVALYVDSVDDFNNIMRNVEGFSIGDRTYYIEPYNMTYIGVWED